MSKWSKLSGEIKVENNSSTESAMNNSKTSKTPRKGGSQQQNLNRILENAHPARNFSPSLLYIIMTCDISRLINVYHLISQ